jgi:hypothetical protein
VIVGPSEDLQRCGRIHFQKFKVHIHAPQRERIWNI